MDYEKYYKLEQDACYSLHFANKDRLDISEIRKIFSTYGRVIHINFASKDQSGLTFVKYKNLPDVISCIKGLKNNSKIQFLPEKSKMNNSSQQQAAITGNSLKKTLDKQLDSNFIHDNMPNLIKENSTDTRAFNGNNEPNNFLDMSFQNFMHKPNLNVIRDNELDSSVFNGKCSLPSKQQTSTETNSSDTIDYEKYYRTSKNGTYTVHFANRKGLSFEEINKLFSVYGNILSMYNGGNNKILVFVRYKTLEEIIKCLKGLQNNTMISILPQKDKIMCEATTDQRSSTQWQAARTEDTSQKIFSNSKQFDSNSIHNERSLENREKLTHNMKTSDLNTFKDTDNFSDTSHSSRQSCHFNGSEIKYKNTNSQMSNEKYSFLRQQNRTINEDYQIMKNKQQETKLYSSINTETDVKMDQNIRINTHNFKIPELISVNTETKSSESDVISDSLIFSGTKNFSPKIVYIPMQEVIVANINMNYGVHYILHLFEKHDPISATLVKIIPENNMRYCHVYFKTVQDAIAVEEEFDNFDLFGKNLIVLRKSRLIGETTSK